MAQRSPNYPALGLTEAVRLLEAIWGAEGASTMTTVRAVEAMGFKGYSGPTRSKVSALRKYGLIEQVGDEIRVSDLGKQIAAPVKGGERDSALRQAGLRPELFKELLRDRADASDDNLQSVLERDGFSAKGARQAIAAYRDTIALAKLTAATYNQPDGDYIPPPGSGGETQHKPPHNRDREKAVTVLSMMVGDRPVELTFSGPALTKGEIKVLRQYLEIQASVAPDHVPAPKDEPPAAQSHDKSGE